MNTKQYITAITYIILLRITDLGLTFIYTPNLRYEWNPIVSVFNYSWIGMLITQILIISLIIVVMSFYFNKKPITGLPNDLSFNEYIYYYFHNERKVKKRKLLKPTRQNINRVLAYNGFILMTLSISISYLAIINNLMVIYKVRSYSNFIGRYGNSFYITILIVLAILSFILFFIMEYNLYRKNLAAVTIYDKKLEKS
jgi:hypothetical protein